MNRKALEEAVRKAVKKFTTEGQYQKYVRKTYKNMFAKIAQGKRKNTAPFTEDPHMGKSPPVDGGTN